MSSKFLWRLGIWGAFMLYLALDLMVFKGPADKMARKAQGLPAKDAKTDPQLGIAARVFHRPIYLSQIDYAVDQELWAKGRKRESVSPEELRFLRNAALTDLIDQYILREKVKANRKDFPVSAREVNDAYARFIKRFKNQAELEQALKHHGFEGAKELRQRLLAQIQQQKYITSKIEDSIAVTDEAAKEWHDEHKDELTIPEQIKVQHIFLAKLENKEADALLKLREIKHQLTNGTPFSQLVTHSEDENTKRHSGNLGWIRRGRIAKDFTDAAFATPLNTPTIITTSIGWHLINVTHKKAAQPRSFEHAKNEIIIALENINRAAAVQTYRINLRKQHYRRIQIHHEVLKRDWTKLEE